MDTVTYHPLLPWSLPVHITHRVTSSRHFGTMPNSQGALICGQTFSLLKEALYASLPSLSNQPLTLYCRDSAEELLRARVGVVGGRAWLGQGQRGALATREAQGD